MNETIIQSNYNHKTKNRNITSSARRTTPHHQSSRGEPNQNLNIIPPKARKWMNVKTKQKLNKNLKNERTFKHSYCSLEQ
jgi:hypothetical protein